MNLCRSCGEDFSSVEAFDRHRVGVHGYTLSEGLKMEPAREDGRRCLYAHELEELGWQKNPQGRWFSPERASRAGVRFQGPQNETPERTGASL